MTNLSRNQQLKATDPVAQATAIAEVLASRANEVDAGRRLTDESVRALIDAGMFRLTTPREFGGFGVDITTLSEVGKALARSCASSAWVTMILNGKWIAAHFGDEARQEIFESNPDSAVASVFTPSGAARPVGGGYQVSGRWPWASGILHAQWGIGVTPIVDDTGAPVGAGLALMPIEDLLIEDTWYTVGMRGTGSNTMVANDVFVPKHRMLPLQDFLDSSKAADVTLPVMLRRSPFAAAATSLAAPMIGVAQAALAYVTEKAPKRAISYTTYSAQSDSPAFIRGLGEAAMEIDSAEMHLARSAHLIDEAATDARELTMDERRKVRGDIGHAMNQVLIAFHHLMTLHGTSAFAEVSPLQRMWRDANTGCRHAFFAPAVNYEVYGGSLVGTPSITDQL